MSKKFLKKLKTYSYNWQQGSRLQWISNTKFIFNDYNFHEKSFFSRIIDVNSNEEYHINFPIYDVYKDIALSLNFNRLALLRPDYGYYNKVVNMSRKDKQKFIRSYDEDGVYKINLLNNQSTLVIPFSTIINLSSRYYIADNFSMIHKFNHIMISPDGEHFVFLHRYFVRGRKYDRLIISDIHGVNIKVLCDEQMVSHYCWKDATTIICYMRVLSKGDGYYYIDIKNNSISPIDTKINKFGDGHPMIYDDFLFFDTYPDKSRMQNLFMYNLSKQKLIKIGEFLHSFKFKNECRCDLHPKISTKGNYLFIDSVYNDTRGLYYISINDILKEYN